MTSTDIIERLKTQLGLFPHPSGYGYFKESFRGDRQVTFTSKTSHSGPRSTGTTIYFLLKAPSSVKWHKHMSDEGFYWHAGGKIKVHMLRSDGQHEVHQLGDMISNPDCVGHVVVPHDTWYATELNQGADFAVFSAVVMPGFEFEDWILADREKLIAEFPQHKDIITRLT